MKTYRVTWEVDVEANSPREAAVAALRMQDEHTTANVFITQETTEAPRYTRLEAPGLTQYAGEPVVIDLGDEPRHLIPLD